MVDKKERYLVGWCPNCGKAAVVSTDGEWTCECGHPLHHLVSCTVPSKETGRDKSAGCEGDPRGTESCCDDKADSGIRELFCELFGDDDCDGCPLNLEDEPEEANVGKTIDPEKDRKFWLTSEKMLCEALIAISRSKIDAIEEELDEGRDHMFMVTPTPFPVWVHGRDWQEASATLTEDFDVLAEAGFKVALEKGDIHFTVTPCDGDAPGTLTLYKVAE